MATAGKNLSEFNPEQIPNGTPFSFGIVVSEWNEHITGNLLKGAKEALLKAGVLESNIQVIWVPGSYELPLSAQYMFEHTKVDGVICIGSVIQGETRHFDFVCEACAQGVKDVSLKYNKPAIFCVLTDNTEQQAIERSGGKHGNKGVECAIAGLKMVAIQHQLKK